MQTFFGNFYMNRNEIMTKIGAEKTNFHDKEVCYAFGFQ